MKRKAEVGVLVKAAVRRELRQKHRMGIIESFSVANQITDGEIDAAESVTGVVLPGDVEDGVYGGVIGDLLKKIIAFLQTEEGQKLIEMIVKILLGLLVV